jgi:membrane protein
LFAVGKYLIGLYLGQSGTVSAFGAAGSLVVILLWVYYSSQILLFGAEFTQVYANRKGKPIVATANAEPIPDEEGAPQRAPGKAKAVPSATPS